MPKHFLITLLLVFGFSINSSAQYGSYYKEFGITAGPVFFQSDYGARGEFKNFISQNGLSVGGHYYFTPNEEYQSLYEHVKLRVDIGYMFAKLKHYGKYVDGDSNSLFTNQLRAMSAKVSEFSVGGQIEYFPFKTDDYIRGIGFTPYISLGGNLNFCSVVSSTSMGTSNVPSTTPVKYLNAVRSGSITVPSITGGIGTRLKISDYEAVSAELSAKYYFSDYVDGLNPNRKVYTENKSNDWATSFNLGYIYYFN